MTNRELAQQLNLSPAALSLIINNKPGVSDATRTRVLNQLHEMGLDHLIKKPLVTAAPSNNLCFIIYKKHGEILDLHPFFLLLMESVENHARTYGYSILLYTVDKRRPIEPQIKHVNELDSKGAIIFATEMFDDDLEAFQSLRIPFVALDNDFTRQNCNTIAINNQMGTFQAIDYLVKTGHSRIGYLKSKMRISSFKERHQGYDNALAHFRLSFAPQHILNVLYSEEGSYRDIRQYLQDNPNPDLPDAFVCDDDTIAVGALRALAEYGIRVPDDISIIGFNDRPICEVTNPPLTTINVSKHILATAAVDEIMRLIENKSASVTETRSRKTRIGTNLIIRDSVSR